MYFKEIIRLAEFEKDLKQLSRKFRTLEDDLRIFIETELFMCHKLKKDNNGIFRITGLGVESPKVYKAKKFACRALKGRGIKSGIRVIYAYDEARDRITLIEIYYKSEKENENKSRITTHLKVLQQEKA